MCPNNLGAAIKDAENKSRTVLVRSLLCGFYNREELLSKTFKKLDKDVIEACVSKCSNIHFSRFLCLQLINNLNIVQFHKIFILPPPAPMVFYKMYEERSIREKYRTRQQNEKIILHTVSCITSCLK